MCGQDEYNACVTSSSEIVLLVPLGVETAQCIPEGYELPITLPRSSSLFGELRRVVLWARSGLRTRESDLLIFPRTFRSLPPLLKYTIRQVKEQVFQHALPSWIRYTIRMTALLCTYILC